MIEELFALLVVVFLVFAPGFLLSLAVFAKTDFGWFEKVFFGAVLGMLTLPLLAILEFVFFGVLFSPLLVFLNSFLVSVFAVALLYKNKFSLEFLRFDFSSFSLSDLKDLVLKNKVLAILLVIVFFGFFARVSTSFDPYFFEFDPYYYDFLTEMIVKDGSAPVLGQASYFPQSKFHRDPPLMQYMTGGWYLLFQTALGSGFDKIAMINVIQLYPPLVGALLSFLAFVFLREEVDEKIALLVAALFAFTPQLIRKLSAGVSEQQPFGIFLILLVLTFYALAVTRKSLRFAILAAFSVFVTMLGTLQFIFPLMVLSGFILIHSLLDFLTDNLDRRMVLLDGLVVAGAVLGNLVLNLYQARELLFLHNGVILLLVSFVPSVVFLFLAESKFASRISAKSSFSEEFSRFLTVGLLLLVLLCSFLFVPFLNSKVGGYVDFTLGISTAFKPILKTVQEEAGSNPALDESSYGVFSGDFLGPSNLLRLVTLLTIVLASLAVLKKVFEKYSLKDGVAFFVLAVGLLFTLSDPVADFAATSVAEVFGMASSHLVRGFVENNTLLFLTISLLAVSISYLYHEKKSKLMLFSLLVFFPTAFIGLQKVKFTLHLAFAICIMFGFVLAEVVRLFEESNHFFKLASEGAVRSLALSFVVVFGVMVVFVQFAYAVGSPMQVSCDSEINQVTSQFAIPFLQKQSAMISLCYGRISEDWKSTFEWMKTTPEDSRFMSWWDYGHWTTFFGERSTVIDPNNAFDEYDQEVAHAIVGGDVDELVDVMHYHKATHLLLDAELIPKWGALVYLSGTWGAVSYDSPTGGVFNGLYREPDSSNNRNVTPAIVDWELGPGQSVYEQEHYFETLFGVFTASGEGYAPMQCPGRFPRIMYFSSLTGALYCQGEVDGQTQWFFLKNGRTGEQDALNIRPEALIPKGADPRAFSPSPLGQYQGLYINVHPNYQFTFLNVDPDLETVSGGRLESGLFESVLVQLYFCEFLRTCDKLSEKGFEYEYRSPNGQVKIFKLVK
ncbi:MAG: STT3 domain-containing protein [Candidatus Micrarchaeia archaeon]